MPVVSPIQFSVGIGASGALVDVSAYVEFGDGINKSMGKTDQFRDTEPGTFSVTLNNRDGRFTPNNTPTVVTATTLSASTAVGATSFTTAVSIPAGSFVAIDTGANAEVVLTGTPTGGGPFTIPIVTAPGTAGIGLRIAHSSGIAVAAASTVAEGTATCLNVGGRLTAGSVLSIELPASEQTWGQVVLTSDDMLGNAARRQLTVLADSINEGATQYLHFPLDDPAGTTSPREVTGAGTGILQLRGANGSAFGVAGIANLAGTQLMLSDTISGSGGAWPLFTFTYPTSTLGFYSFWITPVTATAVTSEVFISGLARSFQFGYASGAFFVRDGSAGSVATYALADGQPHYVSMGLGSTFAAGNWTITATLYLDGTSQGSIVYGSAIPTLSYRAPVGIFLYAVSSSSGAVVSRLSHTLLLPQEPLALGATEAVRLRAIDATTAEVTLASLPSDLSTASTGFPSVSSTSALDAINDVLRTEQGYLYCTTAGSLTSPSQAVNVRARTRPAAVSYTFDASTEIADVPAFVRDLTNTVSAFTANGPSSSATYVDRTLATRAGSATGSETVLNTTYVDLLAYAQDRSLRGKNLNLRVISVTIDVVTVPTNRLADLLAMIPGDRIRVNNLPSATLGFTAWDAWLLGVKEHHRGGRNSVNSFELFLAPVLPATAIYDTSFFMADGAVSLFASINSSVTSASFLNDGTAALETATFPYSLLIDSEQVTVTACTAGTPQVATIVRGQGGTAAAAHTPGVSTVVEITPASLYAF